MRYKKRISGWNSIALCIGTIVFLIAAPLMASQAAKASMPAQLASKSLLLDLTSVGERTVAVGHHGHILLSDDGGRSWRQVQTPTRSVLTGVYFNEDNTRGWAVGHDGTLLSTEDAGETWQLLSSAPEEERPLFDVTVKGLDGFAIGAYAKFMVTMDAGKTWTAGEFITQSGREESEQDMEDEEAIPFDYHLNRVIRADTGSLYIAAEAGYLFRSDDNGKTWKELPSPYEGSYFGTLSLGGDSLLVYGLRGHMFRSEDAGETWQDISTNTTALLTGGAKLSDGTVVVTGMAGVVLVSTDQGRSFQMWQQPGRYALTAVVETSQGSVVVAGEKGVKRLDVAKFLSENR